MGPVEMYKMTTLVAITVLLVLLTQDNLVSAIKCYVCQSNVDPKCADPFDNLTLPVTDCDAYPRADLVPRSELNVIEEKGFFSAFGQSAPVVPLAASMCRKIRQKVNGEWRTIRGCGYLSSSNDSPDSSELGCKIRYGTYDIFVESCACNSKDGCNAAWSSNNLETSNYAIMFSLALLSLILSISASFF